MKQRTWYVYSYKILMDLFEMFYQENHWKKLSYLMGLSPEFYYLKLNGALHQDFMTISGNSCKFHLYTNGIKCHHRNLSGITQLVVLYRSKKFKKQRKSILTTTYYILFFDKSKRNNLALIIIAFGKLKIRARMGSFIN